MSDAEEQASSNFAQELPIASPDQHNQHVEQDNQHVNDLAITHPLQEIPTQTPPPHTPRYHAILTAFMSHCHEKSTPYDPQTHQFYTTDLMAITPHQISTYLTIKAFGTPNPEPNSKLISNWASIDFIRKAIHHFMPLKQYDWDEETQSGNPTRSALVQGLMCRIRSLSVKNETMEQQQQQQHVESADEDESCEQLLRKVHERNVEYLKIIQAMDSTVKTLTRTITQMRYSLESSNLQIQNEIMDNTELSPVSRLKEEEAGLSQALDILDNGHEATPTMHNDMRIGPDGYCTFYNETGKELDLPDGFELPTCDLIDAWTAWLTGFPHHKFRMSKLTPEGNVDTLVDAPIRPLRNMKLGSIPLGLKKKYKDGWRPILQTMIGDVEHMLEGITPAEMDEQFINSTFTAAMEALIVRAPAMFDGKSERSKTWKVATWSRKIREQMGIQRRTVEDANGGGAQSVKEEVVDVAMVDHV